MIEHGLKHLIRSLIAGLLYYTGVMFVLALFRLRKRVVVLMYHRILNPSEYYNVAAQKGIVVTTESLKRHMMFLKQYAHIISLSEFLEHIRDKIPFQRRSCLVTFDDGWEDNFRNALPILREFQIPAVIFLTGSYIDTQKRFWQEDFLLAIQEIRRLFKADDNFRKEIDSNPVLEKIYNIMTANNDSLEQETQVLIDQVKKWAKEKRDQLLASLKLIAGQIASQETDTTRRSFMNNLEITKMIKEGVTIGSHGMSHEILTTLSTGEIERELSESRDYLRRTFSIEADAFSYPNGNYNESIIDMVKQNGYRVAFGTQNGYVRLGDDPYSLHRINIHGDMTGTIPLFVARLLRLW
jgi:peptidoglycan/xylan/chitin deacetylase (PgdA/CDA1 family)